MSKMVLNDGTAITIEDGASLRCIHHIADDETAAQAVCAYMTGTNLQHVEFQTDSGDAYGVYDNLIIDAAPMRQTNEDGTVTVTISLRKKTDIELRLDALELGHDINAGGIAELASIIGGEV